jgi:hypothetical protein
VDDGLTVVKIEILLRLLKGRKVQALPISPARQRTQGVGREVRTSVVDSQQSESFARRGLFFTRCGEMQGLRSGGEFVLVDETVEDVASADRATPADQGGGGLRRRQVKAGMRPGGVVMLDILGEDGL